MCAMYALTFAEVSVNSFYISSWLIPLVVLAMQSFEFYEFIYSSVYLYFGIYYSFLPCSP